MPATDDSSTGPTGGSGSELAAQTRAGGCRLAAACSARLASAASKRSWCSPSQRRASTNVSRVFLWRNECEHVGARSREKRESWDSKHAGLSVRLAPGRCQTPLHLLPCPATVPPRVHGAPRTRQGASGPRPCDAAHLSNAVPSSSIRGRMRWQYATNRKPVLRAGKRYGRIAAVNSLERGRRTKQLACGRHVGGPRRPPSSPGRTGAAAPKPCSRPAGPVMSMLSFMYACVLMARESACVTLAARAAPSGLQRSRQARTYSSARECSSCNLSASRVGGATERSEELCSWEGVHAWFSVSCRPGWAAMLALGACGLGMASSPSWMVRARPSCSAFPRYFPALKRLVFVLSTLHDRWHCDRLQPDRCRGMFAFLWGKGIFKNRVGIPPTSIHPPQGGFPSPGRAMATWLPATAGARGAWRVSDEGPVSHAATQI